MCCIILKSPNCVSDCAARTQTRRQGGRDPSFFSVLSTTDFKYLHPEAVDFRIIEPELAEVQGPRRRPTSRSLADFFPSSRMAARLNETSMLRFSRPAFNRLSYMISGGISHRLAGPHFFIACYFRMDLAIQPPLSPLPAQLFFTPNPDATLMSAVSLHQMLLFRKVQSIGRHYNVTSFF